MTGENPGIDGSKFRRGDTLIGTPDFGGDTLRDIGKDTGEENPLDAIVSGENGPGIFIPPLEMLDKAQELIGQMTQEERDANAEKIAAVQRVEDFYQRFLDSAQEKLSRLNSSQFTALDSREMEVLQRWADRLPEGNEFKAKVEIAIEESNRLKKEKEAEAKMRRAEALDRQRLLGSQIEKENKVNLQNARDAVDRIPDGYVRQMPVLDTALIRSQEARERSNAPTVAVPKLQNLPPEKNFFGKIGERFRNIFGSFKN